MPEEIKEQPPKAAETTEEPAEEPAEEPTEEPAEETPLSATIEKTGELFSPAGIWMIPAIILDLIGLILFIFAVDDGGVLDIIGIIVIGGWMLSRSGVANIPARAQRRVAGWQGLASAGGFMHQKAGVAGTQKKSQGWLRKLFRGKGKWQKYLVPFVGEITPYLGGIAFCWTLTVYYELTS